MSDETMKAAMLYGVKDLRLADVEVPKVEDGEVLVRIRMATTCGTDLKIYQRGYIKKVIELPSIFGHEWAGEVAEAGRGLGWPVKNMRVRAGNSAPCLRCPMCQKGNYNLCENMIWLWGAYAEYVKVPARMVLLNMQEIPQNVSYEEAAIAEPLACVLHGVESAKIKIGDTVVIIGAGPIGLLHLLLSKKIGAEKTIIIDLVEERLRFAEKLGADHVINGGEGNIVEKILSLTDGYGADVVVEAIGLPATWQQALKLARKGGTVLEFGGCPPGARVQVDAEKIHYGEMTILGTFHATPSHFRKAVNLIASRTIDVRPLVTRKTKLKNIKEAFEKLSTSKSEIKIGIMP
jgi:L-iditol 2-dehydrogenase